MDNAVSNVHRMFVCPTGGREFTPRRQTFGLVHFKLGFRFLFSQSAMSLNSSGYHTRSQLFEKLCKNSQATILLAI